MHGNLHAASGTPFSLNRASADSGVTLWLAFPTARAQFDASKLSDSDRTRLNDARGERRRADFEVSRALLSVADVGTAAHSMSHSAEHAALLIAPAGWRVGVDLEFSRPRDVLRLARFAFDEREACAIQSAPPESRQALFYTLWTLKESFAKALQLNLVDALRRCVFWMEGGVWQGHVPASEGWSALVFQPQPEIFIAAACLGADLGAVEQLEWPPKQRADWPIIAACAASPSTAAAARA